MHDEFDYTVRDKDKLSDVLDRFEAYFRPQHNMIHAWYRIETTFRVCYKTQSDFVCRLKDIAKQCEFTNSDEVVAFLFLIHNKHSELKQGLLKCVTKDTTLIQYLEYAHSIEGLSDVTGVEKTISMPRRWMKLSTKVIMMTFSFMMTNEVHSH